MLQSGGKTRIVTKTEIQDDHLGEIKWRGIFDLLPSEEWSKLVEREVNLVGIRIRKNLVQVAITRNHENEDAGASEFRPQTQKEFK